MNFQARWPEPRSGRGFPLDSRARSRTTVCRRGPNRPTLESRNQPGDLVGSVRFMNYPYRWRRAALRRGKVHGRPRGQPQRL